MIIDESTWNGTKYRFTFIDTDKYKEFSPLTQAYGVCFTEDGQVVIGRHEPNKEWCLPGGKIEPGETPEETLVRELDEELSLEPIKFQLLGVQKVEFLDEPEKKPIYQLRYVAIVKITELTPDPDHNLLWERIIINPDEFTQFILWKNISEHLLKRSREWFEQQDYKR